MATCDAAQRDASKALHLGTSVAWEKGRVEAALISLERASCIPPIQVLLLVLKKCREHKSLAFTKRLQTYFHNKGLQGDALIGNYLVPALVDCGAILEAELVFKNLTRKNEHSWTSLILWYARSGRLQDALGLYQKMQRNGVYPSSFTLVALLKSCANLHDIVDGRQIHADVVGKGFDADLFIGSTLIDMYVKCKLTAEAWKVFCRVASRDVVLWTSMILGFAEHGPACKASQCFSQMQLEGVSPNAFTFSCVLKACATVDHVHDLQMEILQKGFERDIYVGKSLVAMYAKHGKLADAQKVFDSLQVQDVVSWTALICGHVEHGSNHGAVERFEQMRLQGIWGDAFTFSSALKACGTMGALEKGLEIHKEILQEGFETDPTVGSTLVSMYICCNLFQEAKDVFNDLPDRCVISWNALIGGFADNGALQEALNCMHRMQKEGIFADVFTFSQVIRVSGVLGTRDRGQEVHTEAVYRGYDMEDFVGRTLVGMYAKLGLLKDAQGVFDELRTQDVVSWTTLITGYTEYGFADEAIKCFDRMQRLSIPSDSSTLACMIRACRIVGAPSKGSQIHQEVLKRGFESDPCVATSLFDMYAKGGSPAEVCVMVNKFLTQDTSSWNSLISGFGIHEGHWAVECFETMLHIGVKPDDVTFACVLTACSHASFVHKGCECFRMMIEDYKLSPSVDHYTCMIDLLARTGHLSEALAYLEKMNPPPDLQTYRALFSACKIYGGLKLASECFNRLVQMCPDLAISNEIMVENTREVVIAESPLKSSVDTSIMTSGTGLN